MFALPTSLGCPQCRDSFAHTTLGCALHSVAAVVRGASCVLGGHNLALTPGLFFCASQGDVVQSAGVAMVHHGTVGSAQAAVCYSAVRPCVAGTTADTSRPRPARHPGKHGQTGFAVGSICERHFSWPGRERRQSDRCGHSPEAPRRGEAYSRTSVVGAEGCGSPGRRRQPVLPLPRPKRRNIHGSVRRLRPMVPRELRQP